MAHKNTFRWGILVFHCHSHCGGYWNFLAIKAPHNPSFLHHPIVNTFFCSVLHFFSNPITTMASEVLNLLLLLCLLLLLLCLIIVILGLLFWISITLFNSWSVSLFYMFVMNLMSIFFLSLNLMSFWIEI